MLRCRLYATYKIKSCLTKVLACKGTSNKLVNNLFVAPTSFKIADEADDAGPSESLEESNEAYYIAIGRQDGRVLLFDVDGKTLGNQTLDADGSRIIEVEWTPIERRLHSAERPRRMAGPTVPHLPIVVGKEKRPIKSTAARIRLKKNEV